MCLYSSRIEETLYQGDTGSRRDVVRVIYPVIPNSSETTKSHPWLFYAVVLFTPVWTLMSLIKHPWISHVTSFTTNLYARLDEHVHNIPRNSCS